MKTSKGRQEGYNGVAAADKKHQVIVQTNAFGEGQEHHALKPALESIRERYNRLAIHPDVLRHTTITADTGFANEANMQYLHAEAIDAYVPDNQFRS